MPSKSSKIVPLRGVTTAMECRLLDTFFKHINRLVGLTPKDLKDKLEEFGLSSKGTHKVLCERLLEHLQGKSQNPVKCVIVKKRKQTPKQTPKQTGRCKLWVSGITTMCPECKKLSLNKLQVHVYGGDYICEICDQEVNYMWHCNRRGCKGKAKYASDDE